MEIAEGAASPLAIALFGAFDVRLEGRPMPQLRSRKSQWLLALLTLQDGRAVERAWLAGTLWPDSTEQQAAFNLRRNLTDLRHALGPQACRLVTPTTHTLRLHLVGVEADLLVFDEAISRGDAPSLEHAIALHRGPLLQDCAEEWVLPEREAREQAYLTALERLAADAMARGDAARAVGYLRRLVAADPLRDSAHRTLMEALAAAGDVAAATQVYRDFRHRLHEELNAAPDAATTAFYQQVRDEARQRADLGAPRKVGVQALRRSGVQDDERPTTNDERSTPEHLNVRSPECLNARRRLPRPLTRLVGREQDVREIRARMAEGPLVTLTGMGGIGKTRLAIRVAEQRAAELSDGAWFVDLAPLPGCTSRRPSEDVSRLVSRTVARVLGVPEQPFQPVTATLVESLRDRQLLLVLDNCEHLLDACAVLVQTLLDACPQLEILITSRQPLGLTGEVIWRVAPLSLPDDTPWQVGKEPASAAVRLFLERAIAAAPGFRVSARNAAAVAEVCRRLDGIPLAIELAAMRLPALSVEELAARLEGRFRLLTHGSRTAQPRQQTLQATMDWSYDLLSEPEQVLLRRLSVFAGGWTLEAAEAVCGDCGFQIAEYGLPTNEQVPTTSDEPAPADGGRGSFVVRGSAICDPKSAIRIDEVLDLLTALVEKSLISYEEIAGEGRYRLLETVRQFAHDRLLETAEAPTLRSRHLAHFQRWVRAVEPKLGSGGQRVWLDRLEREHDNLHAAIEWSLAAKEGCEQGLALTLSLFSYWDLRNRSGEAREFLQRFLDRSAEWPPETRARVLHRAGTMAMRQADYPAARRYFEESRVLRRQEGQSDDDPSQLECLGALALQAGEYVQATALLHESLRLSREREQASGREFDPGSVAWKVELLAMVAYCQGDFPAALSLYEECLTLFRGLDDKVGIASALLGFGSIATMQGEVAAARALLDQSLSLFREVKSEHSAIGPLLGLARIGWREGAFAEARSHVVESLRVCRETRRYVATIDTLVAAGHLAQRQEDSARAVRLFAAAAALREPLGQVIQAVERTEYEDALAAARAALGEEAFAAAWAEGRAMSLDQAVGCALDG